MTLLFSELLYEYIINTPSYSGIFIHEIFQGTQMLQQERFAIILNQLENQKTVSLQDLVQLLGTSESTIRRDLNQLDEKKLLHKVFGGATALGAVTVNRDRNVIDRQKENIDEKTAIAKFAAGLIEDNDFVYLDAGTTTELMIDFIDPRKHVSFVTNGLPLERLMKIKGLESFLIGGELKIVTEALVGYEATENLRRFHFTKGFFGTNSIDALYGFTTPDPKEAAVKREAINRTRKPYILADRSKFCDPYAVSFADISCGTIITGHVPPESRGFFQNIVEVNI